MKSWNLNFIFFYIGTMLIMKIKERSGSRRFLFCLSHMIFIWFLVKCGRGTISAVSYWVWWERLISSVFEDRQIPSWWIWMLLLDWDFIELLIDDFIHVRFFNSWIMMALTISINDGSKLTTNNNLYYSITSIDIILCNHLPLI